jgi:hypothetical protein
MLVVYCSVVLQLEMLNLFWLKENNNCTAWKSDSYNIRETDHRNFKDFIWSLVLVSGLLRYLRKFYKLPYFIWKSKLKVKNNKTIIHVIIDFIMKILYSYKANVLYFEYNI